MYVFYFPVIFNVIQSSLNQQDRGIVTSGVASVRHFVGISRTSILRSKYIVVAVCSDLSLVIFTILHAVLPHYLWKRKVRRHKYHHVRGANRSGITHTLPFINIHYVNIFFRHSSMFYSVLNVAFVEDGCLPRCYRIFCLAAPCAAPMYHGYLVIWLSLLLFMFKVHSWS